MVGAANHKALEEIMKNIQWPAPFRVIGQSIVDWWDSWLDFEIITVVWFFAQFTIILGPPATFGVYHVIHILQHEGESTGVKGMFQGAKMYFGKALLWGLINWVALILSWVNITFYAQVATTVGAIAQWIVILLTITYLVAQFYTVAFFMQMQDDHKKVFTAMRNGLFLALGEPIFTLVLVLFATLLAALSVAFVIPIFLAVPALIAVLGSRGMRDRLVKYGKIKKDLDPREVG
jgi:uncharacterized membrane protein YesL